MILHERRRPALTAPLLGRVGVIWLIVATILLGTSAVAIAALRFPDPDDTLRLIEVRDLIAGQGWFDLHQHRIDAVHGGVAMHWSRLVDLPLAGTILLLRPLLGTPLAETFAAVFVPLLTLGCALLLAARIAWRLFDLETAGFACLALALSVPVIAQLRPLRIDHHGWQIVLALAAVNGLLARSPRIGGWTAGLALAAWLSISLEGLPLAAVIAALAAVRWLRDRTEGALLTNLMAGLVTGSAALFLATRGLSDLAQHCDAVSPVHLALFAWGAGMVTALAALRPNLPVLLGGMALIAGGAVALVLLLAPHCIGGAFVDLDPVVRSFWYDRVAEGQPVWRQPLGEALQIVVPVLAALVASACIAATRQDLWLRRWWADYTILLAAALAIALIVARAGAVAGALAAIPLGWLIKEWIAALRTARTGVRVALTVALVLALQPALLVNAFALLAPRREASVAAPAASCRIADVAAVLRRLPRGDVLAPLDIGPRLLYETRHSVVATSHHRAGKAMRAVIDAFTGSADRAHAIVAERGIEYVALCPDLAEAALYRESAPQGFAAQLGKNQAPEWLEPVPLNGRTTFRVWKVIR